MSSFNSSTFSPSLPVFPTWTKAIRHRISFQMPSLSPRSDARRVPVDLKEASHVPAVATASPDFGQGQVYREGGPFSHDQQPNTTILTLTVAPFIYSFNAMVLGVLACSLNYFSSTVMHSSPQRSEGHGTRLFTFAILSIMLLSI